MLNEFIFGYAYFKLIWWLRMIKLLLWSIYVRSEGMGYLKGMEREEWDRENLILYILKGIVLVKSKEDVEL